MHRTKKVDTILATLTAFLVLSGFLVFASASMGLRTRDGASYSLVLVKQGVIALVGIALLLVVATRVPYTFWKQYAPHIFITTLVLTLLVFVPHVGFSTKGGTRWIDLRFGTVQPSEFLKLGTVIFLAGYYARIKNHVTSFVQGFLPFLGVVGLTAIIMIKQPDIGTFLVLLCAATAVYIAAGARWLHLFFLVLIGVVGVVVLASIFPHVKDRLETFRNPEQQTLGSSYQVRQSLIAIGSGQLTGRGFGQSVQKFTYLPEPIGDSIFSVLSEDFGFVGSALLVILCSIFALRGLRVSDRSSDQFGRLLGVGIVILIASQSFINIMALTGIIPLTGVPLVFVSQGGTALIMAFLETGILLNISKYQIRT